MKRFLTTQSIEFDSSASPIVLRGKARARMKRIAEEGVDDDAKRKLFNHGPEKLLKVSDLKQIIIDIVDQGVETDCFHSAYFTINDVSAVTNFTVRKLNKQYGMCKGKIVDGTCRTCYASTLGVTTYSFLSQIADVDDEACVLNTTCAEGAGTSLFKMKAPAFNNLTDEMKKDAVEKILFVPKKAGFWVKYNPSDTAPLLVMFNVRDTE